MKGAVSLPPEPMLSPPPSISEISPELVLVDPELRALALAQLPEVVPWTPPRPPAPPLAAPSATNGTGARWGARLGAVALRTIFVASIIANAVFVVSLHDAGPTTSLSDARVLGTSSVRTRLLEHEAIVRPPPRADETQQSSPTRVTAGAARVTTRLDHPRLHWVRVASASYYNVVLWRGHRRVLDLWPTTTHVLLPRTWNRGGARGSLVPGRYIWFVYPGIGPKTAAHYGTPVQRGVLIVNESGGNR
jgi:hypothetical protein